LFFLAGILSIPVQAQLAVLKMIGKNAASHKLGFGVFMYYDFPLNDIGNRSLRLELADIGYFPSKFSNNPTSDVYASIKIGYRYIFSEETNSGFYLEPQAGYARVGATDDSPNGSHGDGVAAAIEGGYALGVGQNGNHLNFGLKYEADIAGSDHTIQAIGFRVSYSFNLFRRRRDD